jgi:hypothetical protein
MTNTQIMDLMRNEAINQKTKQALTIAVGIIVVGGITLYYYNRKQQTKITSMKLQHTNYVNEIEDRSNYLTSTVKKKDNILAEQERVIMQLNDAISKLQQINSRQADKSSTE